MSRTGKSARPSAPSTTQQSAGGGGARASLPTRRAVARGLVWTTPTLVVASAAPAYASSFQDITVGKTVCTDASRTLNRIPFTVSTNDASMSLQPGSVFTVQYSGGSTTPTWSGTLAANSTAVIRPGNNTSTNGGRYGTIVLTLVNPMPPNTTWNLDIIMDIGGFVTGQSTRLSLTTAVPSTANSNGSNDTASHEMYFGGCRN